MSNLSDPSSVFCLKIFCLLPCPSSNARPSTPLAPAKDRWTPIYFASNWNLADGINCALSASNASLYSLIAAVCCSMGFIPQLGFVHAAGTLPFINDAADLYKHETSWPVVFEALSIEPKPQVFVGTLNVRTFRKVRDFHPTAFGQDHGPPQLIAPAPSATIDHLPVPPKTPSMVKAKPKPPLSPID